MKITRTGSRRSTPPEDLLKHNVESELTIEDYRVKFRFTHVPDPYDKAYAKEGRRQTEHNYTVEISRKELVGVIEALFEEAMVDDDLLD